VWPAATALAQHLVDRPFDSPPPETALELGAGCGLVSLVALQVYDLKQLVLTDHDPTTLQRAQLNYQATCRQLAQRPETVVAFELLTWGDEPAAKELLASESVKFDLIFGSDLIYDASVVTPLLKTVSWLLASGGKFVYSQSFEYDKITNLEQDAACAELGLQQSRTPLHQNREHATKDTALLQIFQWTPKKMEQI
jgi:predicted nicotinamide N-methyase